MTRIFQIILFISLFFQAGHSVATSNELVSIADSTLSDDQIVPTPEQLKIWQDDPMGAARKDIFTFTRIAEFIQRRFVEDFAANHAITANPDFVTSFKSVFGSDTLTGDKLTALAEFSALQFAVDAALYATYGGRVVFDQSHPMMPVEAYFEAYKDYASKQSLVFHDKALEQRWWLSFARTNAIDVTPEQVDFSAPWWHKLG